MFDQQETRGRFVSSRIANLSFAEAFRLVIVDDLPRISIIGAETITPEKIFPIGSLFPQALI